jgi:4-hydroxybenzoyl-CoA reductase subunit beta
MRLPDFGLERPRELAAAAALAAQPGARVVAGGTDLIPNLRRGLGNPAVLVSLELVAALGAIERTPRGLRIGAGVTLARLAEAPELEGALAVVREAAASVAGPAHRSAATLGGNLCQDTRCVYFNQGEEWRRSTGYCLKRGGDTCHVAPQGRLCRAAYCGDLAPALIALDAELEIVAASGARRALPLAELYREDGAGHLALLPGEIVAALRLPAPAAGTRAGYAKARPRGAVDFPLAGVAMALALEDGRVTRLRVALTGTNSRPFALAGTEALCGRAPDGEALARLVRKQAGPMRTTVTAADYRRQVAAVYAARLLARLAAPQTEEKHAHQG